jgi:hypothetical protein
MDALEARYRPNFGGFFRNFPEISAPAAERSAGIKKPSAIKIRYRKRKGSFVISDVSLNFRGKVSFVISDVSLNSGLVGSGILF